MTQTDGSDLSGIVIDDEFLIALDAAETLMEMGVRVTGRAQTYEDAVRQLTLGSPDFVILDLNLGAGGEGERLLPLIADKNCACVVVSGDRSACERTGRRFPGTAIIHKPAARFQLKKALNEAALRTGRTIMAAQATKG